MEPKYKLDQVLIHNEQKLMMVVHDVDQIPHKGTLYTLQVAGKKAREQFKRYYEEKVDAQCTPVECNEDMYKVLFGENK